MRSEEIKVDIYISWKDMYCSTNRKSPSQVHGSKNTTFLFTLSFLN